MRHQWRLLYLLRTHTHSSNHSHHLKLLLNNPNHLHSHSHSHSLPSLSPIPRFTITQTSRTFSSDPLLAHTDPDHNLVISDIFSKPRRNLDDVEKHLHSNRVSITHDAVIHFLGKPDSNADVARRFFDWVLETHPERLSSKSYNMMLCVLGTNDYVYEFWDLVSVMKKKGYGVSKGVKERVLECFEKSGMDSDVMRLNALFDSGSVDNSIEKKCVRVCRIVKHNVWSDEVENQIRDLGVEWSRDAVKFVLESLGSEPSKALIFFRWLEEGGLFKHDGCTYNAVARVLGREDTIDRFWTVLGDMRAAGCEMEIDTLVKVLGRFCKRKMIKDAVEVYEFAMTRKNGKNKPSPDCCTFLLKKIVVCKELDMDLFSRVLKVFTGSGNVLLDSTANAVLKSLTSVGRTREWNKVLKEMEGYRFLALGSLQSKIAFRLSAAGHSEEACEFVSSIEAFGPDPEHKTWESLVEGHCVAGNLDTASDSFKEMIEKEGVRYADYTFDVLMKSYCQMNRALDAGKILCQLVSEEGLCPRYSTYKLLVTKLLVQGEFADALKILGLMRTQRFPPFTDPFIEYISKCGSGDDAILFLKAITSRKFPPALVFLRMFDAFFKHGRHEEAQNFLSKCPRYIRNHADVLNLFCSMNSKEATPSDKVTL